MSKFDSKKFREEQYKKSLRDLEEKIEATAEMSPSEAAFHKMSKTVSKNKKAVFIGLSIIFAIFAIVVVSVENSNSKESKATLEFEKIEKKYEKNTSLKAPEKIKELEEFQKNFTTKNANLRSTKLLSDQYAANKEYAKAADLLEKIATSIEGPKEAKAYFFYLSGNYREQAKDNQTAMKNYSIVLSLINNNKETKVLQAWTQFQIGRLHLLSGNKDKAIEELKKIIELDADVSANPQMQGQGPSPAIIEVKQLAATILLKLNKG